MDVLSQALGAVRLNAAIFFDVLCRGSWGARLPSLATMGSALSPGAEHLVSYHLIAEGQATVELTTGQTFRVAAGDVVVLPNSDAHSISNGAPRQFLESPAPLKEALSGRPSSVQFGTSGEATRLVCGFLGCGKDASRTFLAGLPSALKVSLRRGAHGHWMEASVMELIAETQSNRPGSAILLRNMAQALFVETLRKYMQCMPTEQKGWLAAARDPTVGTALALLHAQPEYPWEIDELAKRTGVSRSVLGERFAHMLGEAPLSYLTRWRMTLATERLENSQDSVLEIALSVGYASESAFSRAFRRSVGVPPGKYRKERSAARSSPASP